MLKKRESPPLDRGLPIRSVFLALFGFLKLFLCQPSDAEEATAYFPEKS
jgi:hypothetical protein